MFIKKYFTIIFLFTVSLTLSMPGQSEAGTLGKLMKAAGKASRVYRKSTIGKGAMTGEMIENCIVLNRDINEKATELKKSKPMIEKVKKELDELAGLLRSQKGSVDPRDAKAVAAYNEKVNLYQAKAKKYKSLQETFNGKIGIYKQKVSQFDKECKDQQYYKDDYEKAVEKLGYGL